MIGSIAGCLGAIFLLDENLKLNKYFLLTIIAIGYAGADFVEGFMKTKLPKYENKD